MENSEQKYNEALERAREYHKMLINEDNPEWASDLEKIFPELKESDDEEIKKLLIRHIKQERGSLSNDEAGKCIAWLEKQSQVKESPISQHENKTCKENDDSLTSEDESIRKGLINYFNDFTLPTFGGLDPKKILAWLEKKGERKFADGTFVNVDDVREEFMQEVYRVLDSDSTNDRANQIIDAFDSLPTVVIEKQGKQKSIWHNEDEEPQRGSLILLIMQSGKPIVAKIIEPNHTFNHGERWAYIDDLLEKQGEQKTTIEMKTPEESLGIDSDTYNKIVDDCVYGEQKSAWSEEDEKNLQGIIDEIEANKHDAPDYDLATYDRFLSWLKSLRPQNNSVTDEELAQAKKDAYNDALDKIEYHSGEPTFDDGWSAAIWYLKKRNAQTQSTWKPSEEQMVAINTAINVLGKGTLNGKQLIKLQEELKKLRYDKD